MKYEIKYEYSQSNSMNDEICFVISSIELKWNDLKVAQQNLERIQEHLEFNHDYNLYSWNSKILKEDTIEKYKNKDWFVKEKRLIAYNEEKPWTRFVIDGEEKEKIEKNGYKTKYSIDEVQATNCIILYSDDNEPFQMWCPWCEMFEHLENVEIAETKK